MELRRAINSVAFNSLLCFVPFLLTKPRHDMARFANRVLLSVEQANVLLIVRKPQEFVFGFIFVRMKNFITICKEAVTCSVNRHPTRALWI